MALTISTGFAITLFGLDHGVAVGLADDNAEVERQVPEVPRHQKPPCGELSQPGFEHAGSWYRAFLTQVGPWPCGESNFFVDKLVSSFTTLML